MKKKKKKKRLGIILFIAIGESIDYIRSNVFSRDVEKKLEKKEKKILFYETSEFHGSLIFATDIFSEDAKVSVIPKRKKKRKTISRRLFFPRYRL